MSFKEQLLAEKLFAEGHEIVMIKLISLFPFIGCVLCLCFLEGSEIKLNSNMSMSVCVCVCVCPVCVFAFNSPALCSGASLGGEAEFG